MAEALLGFLCLGIIVVLVVVIALLEQISRPTRKVGTDRNSLGIKRRFLKHGQQNVLAQVRFVKQQN